MTTTALLPPPRELAGDRVARSIWSAMERGEDLRPWIQAGVSVSAIRALGRMHEAVRSAARLKSASDRAGLAIAGERVPPDEGQSF